jgi:hypothetical protein
MSHDASGVTVSTSVSLPALSDHLTLSFVPLLPSLDLDRADRSRKQSV